MAVCVFKIGRIGFQVLLTILQKCFLSFLINWIKLISGQCVLLGFVLPYPIKTNGGDG